MTHQLDPKVIVDIGRGLVTLLIGIAAFSLSMLGIVDFEGSKIIFRPIILLTAAINILIAARIIDWMLDRIDVDVWAQILGQNSDESYSDFRKYFNRFDGAYFRIKMFGGAYFMLSFVIASVASISLYFGILSAQDVGLLFSISKKIGLSIEIKLLISTVVFVYIQYQMLTIKSSGGRYFFFGSVFMIVAVIVERIVLGLQLITI